MKYKAYKRELKISKLIDKPLGKTYLGLHIHIRLLSQNLKERNMADKIFSYSNEIGELYRIYITELGTFVYYSNIISFLKYDIPLNEHKEVIINILQPHTSIDLTQDDISFVQDDLQTL